MAGGVWAQNNYGYYLYNGQAYYALSPSSFQGSHAYVFGVSISGHLGTGGVGHLLSVRPVINLKADTIFTGSGTMTDPYVVN